MAQICSACKHPLSLHDICGCTFGFFDDNPCECHVQNREAVARYHQRIADEEMAAD